MLGRLRILGYSPLAVKMLQLQVISREGFKTFVGLKEPSEAIRSKQWIRQYLYVIIVEKVFLLISIRIMTMWSKDYNCCVSCKTTKKKHMAKGFCNSCYQAIYRKENKERIAKSKNNWYLKFVKGTNKQKIAREQRNYDGFREPTLIRDNFKCVFCSSTGFLVVHHKDKNGRGSKSPNNNLDNLITLCRACHINEHRKEILKRKNLKFDGKWALSWDSCKKCGTTKRKHNGHGLCTNCYMNYLRNKKKHHC